MKRTIKTRAYIEDVDVYDKSQGHAIALQCLTDKLKPFELTLVFDPNARERSTRGRNWQLIERMLGDVSSTEWERAHYCAKSVAARVRGTFHWFKIDVNGQNLWLRDVRPLEPFELGDEGAAIAAVEEYFDAVS